MDDPLTKNEADTMVTYMYFSLWAKTGFFNNIISVSESPVQMSRLGSCHYIVASAVNFQGRAKTH